MKQRLFATLTAFTLVFAANAGLVGLYTFDRTNPLEAVIGSPAKEGVSPGNGQAATLDNTMSTLSMVSDTAVLGDRIGVIAVPSRSTLAVPNPGLQKDWTITFWFYAPDNANWRCFFQFGSAANSGNGSLFIRNNTDIGAQSYTTGIQGIVGAWHQLTVSSANNTQTIWYDTTKLDQTRGWNIAGMSLLQFSLDNDGEDAMMYFDEIRLYDETAPADVFPGGLSEGPALLNRWSERPYSDQWGSFSRTPDLVTNDLPYRTYVFSRHCSFTFTPNKASADAEILVVGGGGAGGMLRGGGGGGGGVVHVSSVAFTAKTYMATVGAGGIPDIHPQWYSDSSNVNQLHPGASTTATCGGESFVKEAAGGTVVASAAGGGGGGCFNYANGNLPAESYGLNGASGGGASGKSTAPGNGIDGQGYAGGKATTDGDNTGGGGGGAGGPGTDGSKNLAGDGGPGVEKSITGSPVVYGGGGGASSLSIAGGFGGTGGGGTGVSSTAKHLRSTSSNGVDGLGGGGGGGSGQDNNPYNTMGGRGGDGTVILRVTVVDDDDPEPTISLVADPVGYTNVTLSTRLVTFGASASSATVSLVVSANQDLSNPVFSGVLATDLDSLYTFTNALVGLVTNATYYAQATAVNDKNKTGHSALVSFTTLNPEPPTVAATPAGVGFGTIFATTTLPSFGAGSVDATVYLECSASGAFDDTVSSEALLVDALPFAQVLMTTGLEAGLNYYYRVRAVNTWGLEEFSQTFTAAPDVAPVRLSEISAISAGEGLETLAVSTLVVDPGTTYSLSISVDGIVVRTWTEQTEPGTFSVDYNAAGPHTAVAEVSCSYGGNVYTDSRSAFFSIGSSRIVVADYADHCSAATAIRVYPGDVVVLPELPWGLSYRVLNERFLSIDGLVVTALEPAVAGVAICSGDSVVNTMAVLVLPESIKGGDVYIYNENSSTKALWTRVETWEKIGSAQSDSWPCRPNDIAIVPFYDTTGTQYISHESNFSVGGILFGSFRDVETTCILERHKDASSSVVTFERTDDAPAFVKVTPNTTTARTQTLRFGGHDILVDCVSSVVADSCSGTAHVDINRGKIAYEKCTIHIPEGNYWAVDGLPGYGLNMNSTIGTPQLTGQGTFWKKGMGGITFENQNAFYGTVLDTSHGKFGDFNRAAPVFWHGPGGTNVSVSVAGSVAPRLGNPSISLSGYGWFRTGWDPAYGGEAPHPDVPWNPRKTMTLHGGSYNASSTEKSVWGVGVRNPCIYEKLVVAAGMSYVGEGDRDNRAGHPINYIEWVALEHQDKGSLVIYDPSRRNVAAEASCTNTMTIIKGHEDFLVGQGLDGDCLISDVYPIIPWLVAPTSTDDSSWRNTLFASFDENGRLARPTWSNAALDEAASPFSNAYLWDKTIEISSNVVVNSLFMNNSGKNKWLGEKRKLTITSGGLVMHGNSTAIGQPGRIDNGLLVLGDASHPAYVFAKASNLSSPNQIWADVTAPGGFVSSYSGALVLGGDQTGIGNELVVNAGVLTLGTAEAGCALAKDLPIRICSGATLGLPRADTVKLNTMWFDGVAGHFGKIEVQEGVAAKCKKAYWRNYPETDEWQPILRGVYTGDAATSIAVGAIYDPDHFAGSGTIEVLRDDSVSPLVIRLR